MPFYIYSDDIPFATNNPSVDQPKMQTNTNSIDSLINIDHVSFNDNLGGYHRVIHQQKAPGNVDPAKIDLTGQIYVKDVTNGTTTDQSLFFESGGGRVTQLTAFSAPLTTVVGANNGYVFLPGGILMQWGEIALTTGNPTVTFAAANIDFPNNIFNIQVTRRRSSSSPGSGFGFWVRDSTISVTGFQIISNDGHSWAYDWLAIGN